MKKILMIVAFCVIASMGLMVWGFYGKDAQQAQGSQRYAMLTTLNRGTVVMQAKQGAQTAAAFFGAELSIASTEDGKPADEQLLAMVAGFIQSGVDGIILPPCGEEAFAAVHELTQGKGIVLISLWAEKAAADGFVVTDYFGQGVLLAQAVEKADAVLAADSPQSALRVQGIQSLLGEKLQILTDMDALSALPAGSTVLVTDALLTQGAADLPGLALHIVGIDPGDERISLLEQGRVAALVMEMPYAQGYQAVALLDSAYRREEGNRYLYTESRLITAETMYRPENVKLVFPLLQ